MKNTTRVAIAFALVAGRLGTAHADPADKLAERLAKLRAEVEQLSSDLTDSKTETRNTLRSLARQKSDLSVELDREKVHIAKLRATLAKKRTEVSEKSTDGDDLAPVFDVALKALRNHVASSLPFRTEDRLAELDKIEEQRKTGVLTYQRALSRLWGFIEDELRLTRESAMYRQSIRLGESDQLADVVRVGMVMMFFATSDGAIGYTKKTADGWAFVTASKKAHKQQIRKLFDNFKKQIRVGLFEIPNAIPAESK